MDLSVHCKRSSALAFGPIAAFLLALTILCLPAFVPGYSAVRQTVSEIGEMTSPARWPFAFMLFAVAGCHLIFASGLRSVALQSGLSVAPAWLVGSMSVTLVGVAYFAYPHPLHNVFGLSELIGYQAPLVLALTWRRAAELRRAAKFSLMMAVLQEASLAINLSVLDLHSALWIAERPIYGLIQRTLFASWAIWCFGIGSWLWRRHPSSGRKTGSASI